MPPHRTPGTYTEELPRQPPAVPQVETAVAALFGAAGGTGSPAEAAVPVTGLAEFRHRFPGAGAADGYLAAAVAGFFENGGRRCHIVETGTGPVLPEHLARIADLPDIALLAAPGLTDPVSTETLIAGCEAHPGWFAVLDLADETADIGAYLVPQAEGGLRPRGAARGVAAAYLPWLKVQGPEGPAICPPSGHICGLYAQTDLSWGVHKAPANLGLAGVTGVTLRLNQAEQERLNPFGLNCIRSFGRGLRVWGARTLAISDPEWRYVPVRRLVTMIEQSLIRGTAWTVMEPDSPALHARLRATAEDFLLDLWRRGALMGAEAEDAFYVRCGGPGLATEAESAAGLVVLELGVAPMRPTEFVVLRLLLRTAAEQAA